MQFTKFITILKHKTDKTITIIEDKDRFFSWMHFTFANVYIEFDINWTSVSGCRATFNQHFIFLKLVEIPR